MKPVRYKKVRGKNRILRHIDDWATCNRHLNLDYLQKNQRDYVKFWVKPFSNLHIGNSIYPEPYGEFKERLLRGLFEIYQSWKVQLDNLNKPYYLKIWLFEKHISRSQVVCAIDDCLHFYDNAFEHIDKPNLNELRKLCDGYFDDFEKLNWQKGIDTQYIENTYLDLLTDTTSQEFKEAEKWFNQIKEQAFSVYYIQNPTDELQFYYLLENDKVWIGG
ncbi:hypothetical protein [Moraxella oblonga]|uniref:hypothetical protein n=1 Tax=Moraxella oblonga TaxID=200413 RepID=UPI00083105FB|nr:hypothetical protein [Moraxella oblonga]